MAFRRVMGCQQGRIPVFFVYPVDIYYMKVLDIVRIRAVDVEGARLTAWAQRRFHQGVVTFGRGFKESAVVSLTVSRS